MLHRTIIAQAASETISKKTELEHLENAKTHAKIRVPAKASIWYIASSAISRSIGAAGTPIFTRLLTPEEYGLFPLYNTWLGIFTVIITIELTGSVIYRGLQKYQDQKDEFISSAFGLFLSIFTVFCALYFAFSGFVNTLSGLNTLTTSLMLVQIFANTVIGFYSGKARFEYNYKNVAILNLFSSLGIPTISILIIFLTNIRSEARIIGSATTMLIIGVAVLIHLIKRSSELFNLKIWRFLLRFNLPLIPHYLASALILRIGDITIGRIFGTEALGRYSVAMSVGMSLTIVTNGLLSALSPWMLRKTRAKEFRRIRDFMLSLTKALCAFALLILAFAPEIIQILTPSEFHAALPAVYPLEISVIPMFISGAVMSGEMYFEKSGVSALPSVLSAALCALLSLLILPRIDYRFAALFTLMSYILLAFLNALIFKKLSGENPIHIKKSALVFSLTSTYAVLLFLFRGVIMSRIILILPLLPALFVFATRILKEIKE